MPLLPYTNAPISLRVADRVSDKSAFCQIATWKSISVYAGADGLRLELLFEVVYHGLLADGTPGPALTIGKGIDSWEQTLYANNDCAVYLNSANATDPRNGQILYYRSAPSDGGGWERRAADGTRTALVGGLEAAPEPVIKQGDAFALQMENPLALAQLIRYHLNAANQAPFNKFA